MHDVLDPRDLVPDEAEQRSHSGYDAAALRDRAIRAAESDDTDALAVIAAELDALSLSGAWSYDEPDDEVELRRIAETVPASLVDAENLRDRVFGAWQGRTVGNTMGKPVEGMSRLEVRLYLEAADAWPQMGYIPVVHAIPEAIRWVHPDGPVSSLGTFDDVPRDDDIDWTILGLFMLERYGRELTTEDIAREWLDRLPFTQTFTAERAAYRNLILGKAIPETASHDNPYREWIGALIRADIFGYVHAGDPAAAATSALVDARLSHVKNGVYGEMWAAGLVAAAFTTVSARSAIETSLGVVPAGSRLHEAVQAILDLHSAGADFTTALDWIDEKLGHYNWVATVNNAANIAAALLWGTSFVDTVAKTIEGGADTDSTAATTGSVYGALHGIAAIPAELIGTTHVHVRSAVRGFDRITIEELTDRTMTLIDSFGRE